jgi:hypothetical protein
VPNKGKERCTVNRRFRFNYRITFVLSRNVYKDYTTVQCLFERIFTSRTLLSNCVLTFIIAKRQTSLAYRRDLQTKL